MTKLLGSWALAAMTLAVAPPTVFAYDVPIQASFVAAYTATLNTGGTAYCGGTALPVLVEAHGNGFSLLGPLSLSLQKTLGGGPMHGCLTLSTPDGDNLTAIYDGTENASNANNFASGSGTLAFTGGTGRFKGAKGSATFTAVFDNFYPCISFACGTGPTPLQGMAFYMVQGNVTIGGAGD